MIFPLLFLFYTNSDIDFKNYKQYSELLMDVFEAITGNFEYALSYKENSKGFKTFKVEEVFVLED